MGGAAMPSIKEIQVEQRRKLILLLKLRRGETDIDKAIRDLIAEMDQEDVAWVEKQMSETK